MTIRTLDGRFRRAATVTTSGLALAAVLALSGCSGGDSLEDSGGGKSDTGGKKSGKELTVGSADFTESKLLAQMYAQVLRKAGYKAHLQTVQNRELYEPALEKGRLDIVPEYAATMAEFLNTKKNGPKAKPVASPSKKKTMRALRRLAEPRGLRVLKSGAAVDQNAFAVSRDFARKHHLKTLSDLGKDGTKVRVAAGDECKTRPYCQPGLEKKYGINVNGIDPKGVGTVQSKQAVERGTDQMVLVTTTDASLDAHDLVLLDDDKKLQNADYIVPMLNTKQADKPTVRTALNKLNQKLTTADLTSLNKQVDNKRRKPKDVARQYLTKEGLL